MKARSRRRSALSGQQARIPVHRWLLAVCVGLVATDARPATAQQLPEGITLQIVARGDSVFHGSGFCFNCHGPDGGGLPGLGGNLRDMEWQHADGSLESLVRLVRGGISAERSSTGIPMPPNGGARLSDEQVRAVAAYVWSLSRGGG